KQRFFSWFDSYDIYDDEGNTLYTVKGQLSWGHKLNIYDAEGYFLGTVKERIFTLTPTFELYIGDELVGTIRREFLSIFHPRYEIDLNGWSAEGNFWEWDYVIKNHDGSVAATVSKELFHWTDHYTIDVRDPADCLMALMFVLAVDAEKCSRN
ncbi:MAG: LURP-one-related family protein, partial [Clostridia bacterium]|nr:LURP-one-related family protein [Clostridia bacterium]